MLVIRDEQLELIAQANDTERLRQLREHALAMLDKEWGTLLKDLSVVEREALVERAFEQAARLGFSSTYEIFTLLNAWIALGEDFERDPRCPWAQALGQSGIPAATRAAGLSNHVMLELQRRLGRH